MKEIIFQITKMVSFIQKHDLYVHPRRLSKGGLPYMANLFLSVRHCPCKPDRKKCPCKEALQEIKTKGFCECRLFCTKEVYEQVMPQENQSKLV